MHPPCRNSFLVLLSPIAQIRTDDRPCRAHRKGGYFMRRNQTPQPTGHSSPLWLPVSLLLIRVFLAGAVQPSHAQTESVLYTFTGKMDGLYPASALVSDGAGNFYGTTIGGGTCSTNPLGCGVVFEISPNGSGGWNQTVLHNFDGPPDAANSWACRPGDLHCGSDCAGGALSSAMARRRLRPRPCPRDQA